MDENNIAPEQEKAILIAADEAKKNKNVTKSMTIKEALAFLKKF